MLLYQLGQFLVFKNVVVSHLGPTGTCLLLAVHGQGTLPDFFLHRKAYSAFALRLARKLLGLGDGLF